MNRNQNLNILLLCLLMVLGSCSAHKKNTRTNENPAAGSTDPSGISSSKLAESNNRFALDLFRQIQGYSENLVYSPYSISTVMGMCYSGARAETAAQMSEVLYFPPKGEDPEQNPIDPAFKMLNDKILSSDTLEGTEIKLANAIWAQQGFEFLPAYMDNIKNWYDAPLTQLDFINDANREKARLEINGWVEDNTRQKIRDLISPGVLDANTRMVLTNAIYFNGKWIWPFDENLTAPSIFHISPSRSDMTDFMHMTRSMPYYEDEEVQAIQLPYMNEQLSMTIILPHKVDGWDMISRVIDHERLAKMEPQFKPAEVYVSLPKFSYELKMNLSEALSGMGMDLAFGMKADLSGMNGKKDLFIDEVIHKAFIEVSERGTEAAAATAAVISLKSALREEPLRFNADHPFLYLIRDQKTGSIIFMGRFVRPS